MSESEQPTGGTFTFKYGNGVSDPVPYDADAAAAIAARDQAIERNTLTGGFIGESDQDRHQ